MCSSPHLQSKTDLKLNTNSICQAQFLLFIELILSQMRIILKNLNGKIISEMSANWIGCNYLKRAKKKYLTDLVSINLHYLC